MLKINSNAVASMFVLLMLSACGGDGSDATTSTSTAIGSETAATVSTVVGPLTKYAGVWEQVCDGNWRETLTFTVANDGLSLTETSKQYIYANDNCTGNIVSTEIDTGASITYSVGKATTGTAYPHGGGSETVSVDQYNIVNSAWTSNVTGSGVTSVVDNGVDSWKISYFSGGSTIPSYYLVPVNNAASTHQGSMSLLNGELLILSARSDHVSFDIPAKYTR